MRILSVVYPNPRRTILVGHLGGEEQGPNGSRAFVEDSPEIVDGVQVVMNRDTFDKIVFGNVRHNAMLTAMLAYQAAESPGRVARDRREMPGIGGTSARLPWPECRSPMRSWADYAG